MLRRTWQVYFCDLLWCMPARCTWGSPERSSGQLSKASWALWTTWWFRDANWHFKSMHRLVGALRDAPSCIICCKSIRMQHAEHVEETSTWGIEVDAKSRRSSSTALQQCRAIAALSPHYWILYNVGKESHKGSGSCSNWTPPGQSKRSEVPTTRPAKRNFQRVLSDFVNCVSSNVLCRLHNRACSRFKQAEALPSGAVQFWYLKVSPVPGHCLQFSHTWESHEIRFENIKSYPGLWCELKWNIQYLRRNPAQRCQVRRSLWANERPAQYPCLPACSNNYGSFDHACTWLPESCILSILHHFQGFGQALPQWEPGNTELTLAKSDWRLLMAGSAIKVGVCKRRLYPFLFLSLKALFIGFCLFNDALPRMKTRKMQLWNLWRRKTSHPSIRVQKAVRRIPSGSKRQKDSKVTKDAFLCWAFRKCTSCSTYGISDISEFLPLESLELQSGHRQNHLSPLQRWRHH